MSINRCLNMKTPQFNNPQQKQWSAYGLHPPSTDRRKIKWILHTGADGYVEMMAHLLLLSDILKVLIGSNGTQFD